MRSSRLRSSCFPPHLCHSVCGGGLIVGHQRVREGGHLQESWRKDKIQVTGAGGRERGQESWFSLRKSLLSPDTDVGGLQIYPSTVSLPARLKKHWQMEKLWLVATVLYPLSTNAGLQLSDVLSLEKGKWECRYALTGVSLFLGTFSYFLASCL